MILKTWKKQYRDICVKKCDECGLEKEVHLDGVKQSRLKRNSEIDLCRRCANLIKYKGRMPRGENNKNFKHGLHSNGYRLLTVDDGRKCFEHQYVMEQHLGRRLDKKERIHHIDIDKINNEISNLHLYDSISGHSLCHHQMENLGYDLFGGKIWFDGANKKYVLEETVPFLDHNEYNLDVNKLYKIHYKRTNSYYYKYAYKNDNGKWITKTYHVALMELKIGRKLFIDECVHHIDGDTLDNDINNLLLLTRSEHTVAHISLQHCVAELYKQGIVGFDKDIGKYFVV